MAIYVAGCKDLAVLLPVSMHPAAYGAELEHVNAVSWDIVA